MAVNVTLCPTDDGLSDEASVVVVATWIPVPVRWTGMPMHWSPTTGHSNGLTSPLAAPVAVGVKVSLIVQVPGPTKPATRARGEAERRIAPPSASIVNVDDNVFDVLTGTEP